MAVPIVALTGGDSTEARNRVLATEMGNETTMKRWLNEPLFHFLLAGAVMFGVYEWLNRDRPDDRPQTVRITAQEVDWLKETWARQWQRPPSEDELRGLVTDYLKETLLAREAEELGLAENDTIVRRRLAQKLEFLVQDTVRLAEPGEDELREYFQARRDQYAQPARVSFTQDHGMLPPEMTGDQAEVANVFGANFARQLFALEPGEWPVTSTFGQHRVRVLERQPARVRPFEEVRTRVLEDWHREQQTKANEQFFAALLKKYDVVVDESVRPLIRQEFSHE